MSKLKRYRENILQFVLEEFQATPDKWQELGLLAFASDDPKTFRISLQACAGPGKSTLLCWCGWWFLLVMGDVGEHPKSAAVSITSDNLKDNLWSEMSKWQSRSELLMSAFEWTQTRIYAKDHPNTWFMAARGFAQTADTEAIGRTLSGLHSKYVLYLIDESGDIPPSIIKSAEQGLSTKPIFGKILQAGNPTSHDGMLYAAATTLRDQWHIIRITGDPDDANRSQGLMSNGRARRLNSTGEIIRGLRRLFLVSFLVQLLILYYLSVRSKPQSIDRYTKPPTIGRKND